MERKYKPSRTKDYQLTIAGLVTKRAELAGERNKALALAKSLEQDLKHVDETLRLFGFADFRGIQPLHRAPKTKVTRSQGLERRNAIRELLKANPEGQTTPQIANHIAQHFNDGTVTVHIRNYARKVLNRWQERGYVEVCDFKGQAKKWRVKDNG